MLVAVAYTFIAAIRGPTPRMLIRRVMLYAKTCNAVSRCGVYDSRTYPTTISVNTGASSADTARTVYPAFKLLSS